MKTLYTIIILLLFTLNLSAQFSLTPEPEITVCQSTETFTVKYLNDEPSTLTNLTVKIKLPEGISYSSNSLTETTSQNIQEGNITQDTALLFTANDLLVGDSLLFTISYTANQEAVSFQNEGGIFRNTVTINSTEEILSQESNSYNILYPVLSILSITPKNQTIVSGTSSSRTLNIINGGNGKTDIIYITDIQNTANLTVLSSSIGTISGDTIILSGTDFNTVGNGDNYLDQNESINITESFSGTSCEDMQNRTSFNALWGCEGDLISSSTSYSNITIDFQTPCIKLESSEELNTCFGNGSASSQELMVINTSSGLASNVIVEIYKSKGNGYDEDVFSRIDESSLTYKVGINGTPTSISSPTTTISNSSGDYACLGNNPIGKVQFTLPNIAPQDSIYINWDTYSCCLQTCENDAVKGWDADVDYSDVCGTQNYSKSVNGQGKNQQYVSVFTETPLELYANETEDVIFTFSSFKNTLPLGTGANYTATFILQEGITYESIELSSNGSTLTPTSVTYNTNTATAVFPANTSFNFNKSEIALSISGNCGTPG